MPVTWRWAIAEEVGSWFFFGASGTIKVNAERGKLDNDTD